MKLATYRDGSRDGKLVVVSADLQQAAFVPDIAATMQAALDDWGSLHRFLQARYRLICEKRLTSTFRFEASMCMAPLARCYQWVDGSAFLSHVELVRRARNAPMPPELYDDPLMYQGGGDTFLGAQDDIVCPIEDAGVDFEAEVAVITGDIPMGSSANSAQDEIRLICLVNDVSLRNLIPSELAKGFGFLQSKPSSAFSPVAVTPDELGRNWDGSRLDLNMRVWRNGVQVGDVNCASGMHFSFAQLLVHLTRTRAASAGTIVGSGTVSDYDPSHGYTCIAEKRMLETIESGSPSTAYLKPGDRVRIEILDGAGQSVFGAIEQLVTTSTQNTVKSEVASRETN